MFNITASWHVSDTYSAYNEWETLDSTSFAQGVDTLFDMFINPQNHQCDDEWVNEDGETEWYCTSLNMGRGLFLIQEGHSSFSGDRCEMVPLPLKEGDDGSTYGFAMCDKPVPPSWTVIRQWQGHSQRHGHYDSKSAALFQASGRMKHDPEGCQWYVVHCGAFTSSFIGDIIWDMGEQFVIPAQMKLPPIGNHDTSARMAAAWDGIPVEHRC